MGSCPMPAEGLIRVKKLFAVPSFWVLLNGFVDRDIVIGAEESVEVVLAFFFAQSLNRLAVRWSVRGRGSRGALNGGIADPMPEKTFTGDVLEFFEKGSTKGHGNEQREGRVLSDLVE